MPPSDQEPRYRLVDSNGNVVGALWGDGNGNVKIADETDTQTTFGPDGISTPALEADGVDTNYAVSVANHASIRDAIDAAIADGVSTVYIPAGTYNENLTISTRGINLVGAGPSLEATVIDGGSNTTITLDATACRVANVRFNSTSSNFQINGDLCHLDTVYLDSVGGSVAGDSNRLVGLMSGVSRDITFESVSNQNIIDNSGLVTVTDNGSGNIAGDIA
jgi:hypothetical protein